MFPAHRDSSLNSPSTSTPSMRSPSSSYASSLWGFSSTASTLFGSVNRSIFDETFNQNQRSVSFVSVLDPGFFENYPEGNASLLASANLNNAFRPLQNMDFAIDSGAERALWAQQKISASSEPTRLLEPTPLLPDLNMIELRGQLRNELSSWVTGAASGAEKFERETIRHQILQCFDSFQPNDELIIKAEHVTDLPECIGLVWHIRKLDLSGCRSLRLLPNVLHNFIRLDELHLTNCSNLKALPPSVMALNSDAFLFLSGSGVSLANPINSRVKDPHRPN